MLAHIVLLCSAFSSIAEDRLDAEGYPEIYLRGTFDNNNWGINEKYRFSREADKYTLTVDRLQGEFKISGTDWKYNLGAVSDEVREVVSSTTLQGKRNGRNFYSSFHTPVTIEFIYNADADFTSLTPISITVSDPPKIEVSGTLPVIYIDIFDKEGNRNDEILSKNLSHKNYFDATYRIEIPESCQGDFAPVGSVDEPLPLQIKGRGNYTFQAYSKKPFKLKLGEKQNLLSLTPEKSKHYVLLAHADDNFGFMRNFTGFTLGKLIGLPWTPSQTPVELVINGDYRGLYFLTESIRAQKGRIDIDELNDLETDLDKVSGGYIVELDNYDELNQISMDEKGVVAGHKDKLRITFDTPEVYSPIQSQFVRQQFTTINDLIGKNSDDIWSYIDLDDAVRYYIVEEIISHTEAYHGSTYLFRDRGESQKWHFSPLWDCGNAFNGRTDDYFYVNSPFGNTWVPTFCVNEKFMGRVRDTWLWFMSEKYPEFESEVTEYASLIAPAARIDAARWQNAPLPDVHGAQQVRDNSAIPDKLKKVLDHLKNKASWLATIWGDYSCGYPEPERDDTPCAPLPLFLTSSVSEPVMATDIEDAEYYNLQGIRIKTPYPGQLLIEVKDGVTRKIRYSQQ